jgi:hypothetical protein
MTCSTSMTHGTMSRRHLISLAAACTALVLGCGAGHTPAGHPGPGPEPGAVRIDAGPAASTDAGRPMARDGAPEDARYAVPPMPDAGRPVLAAGVMRGTFIEIQEGDYFHIAILDQAGIVQSFFIAPELPASTWEPFLTSRHRGKLVEIAWDEVLVYVPEAGAEQIIRRATGIRLIERA